MPPSGISPPHPPPNKSTPIVPLPVHASHFKPRYTTTSEPSRKNKAGIFSEPTSFMWVGYVPPSVQCPPNKRASATHQFALRSKPFLLNTIVHNPAVLESLAYIPCRRKPPRVPGRVQLINSTRKLSRLSPSHRSNLLLFKALFHTMYVSYTTGEPAYSLAPLIVSG